MKYYYGDQIKKNEMRVTKNAYAVIENLKRKENLEDLGVDRTIILKLIC
jgi:hypothetical protein